jgi:hypothetical protein
MADSGDLAIKRPPVPRGNCVSEDRRRELITDSNACRNRFPAKLDLNAGTRRQRRRINQACVILVSTDARDSLWWPNWVDQAMDKLLLPM